MLGDSWEAVSAQSAARPTGGVEEEQWRHLQPEPEPPGARAHQAVTHRHFPSLEYPRVSRGLTHPPRALAFSAHAKQSGAKHSAGGGRSLAVEGATRGRRKNKRGKGKKRGKA